MLNKVMTKMSFPQTWLKKKEGNALTLWARLIVVPVSFAWASTPHLIQNM